MTDSLGHFVALEVARCVDETRGSPDSASGDYSKAASSGDGSKAASSGDYSKATSSGDGSTAASSGADTISMVAGLRGRASSGKNGCIALCWHDGKRNRIVVGYVGENIKAETWYGVSESGELVEVTP